MIEVTIARLRPLAGEGASAASMDASSQPSCARQAVTPAGRLSAEDFICIAHDILARGGTWREVGEAVGSCADAARQRGYRNGLRTQRPAGRPIGSKQSAEARANCAAGQKRRWAERGR